MSYGDHAMVQGVSSASNLLEAEATSPFFWMPMMVEKESIMKGW